MITREPVSAREGWYVRSWAPGDVHRGVLEEGSVRAACGMSFYPLLAESGSPACSRLPAPEQLCPACTVRPKALMVIPATCSTHPTTEVVVALVVRGLGNGRVELRSHPDTGCALTVQAALLVNVVGLWVT